jgi:hypothetical protein
MTRRFETEAGIAIGPILFVVAILAILATAIAAGSSTFATNASQETNRTNAAALIQIGSSLKMGFDRIVALGTPVANVDINASNTSSNISLFSPLGGGLVPPSTTLAGTPGSDVWIYSYANWAGLGSNTEERIALLRVTPGVCNQINTQVGVVYTLAGVDYGAFSNTTNLTTTNLPAAFSGKMVGCIDNDTSGTANDGDYVYQILAVQ